MCLKYTLPSCLRTRKRDPRLPRRKQAQESERQGLASGDRADYEQRFPALRNGAGQRCVERLEREVFFAGKEAQEGTTLACIVFADRAGQHGVAGFKGVKDGANVGRRSNREREFPINAREGAQVIGELDADGCGVRHIGLDQLHFPLSENPSRMRRSSSQLKHSKKFSR